MVLANAPAPQSAYGASPSPSGSGPAQSFATGMSYPPVLLGLFSPTGGDWASFYSAETGGYIRPADRYAPPDVIPSVVTIEDTVCRTFNLTMKELADICDKTRKTLYDWRNGSVPRDEAGRHLYALYRAAQNWMAAGNPTPQKPQLTEQPLVNGRTLYTLLREKPIDLDAVRFAGNRLALHALPEEPLEDPFA